MRQPRFIAYLLSHALVIGLFACSQQALAAATATLVTPTAATQRPSPQPPTPSPAAPTREPLSSFYQKELDDPGSIINYAYELLVSRGLEDRWIPDYAHSAQLTFANGDQGALVSIGFSGVTRGYLVLLRLEGDRIEPVDILDSGWDYGSITKGPTVNDPSEETCIEPMDLVRPRNGEPKQIFKVSGWNHMGTGLVTNGFELASIAESGIKIIFTGFLENVNWNNGGWYDEYQYTFADLDGDGDKEIIQVGRECGVRTVQDREEIGDCLPSHRVFKYNGREYAEITK